MSESVALRIRIILMFALHNAVNRSSYIIVISKSSAVSDRQRLPDDRKRREENAKEYE